MIGMPRHISLHTTHCMKTNKYLSAIVSLCGIWILLSVTAPARSNSLRLPPTASISPAERAIAQNLEPSRDSTDLNQDLRLQDITVTQNSADKSLLTVKGSINNRSDKSHYVYYIVAKFISKDASIKQTIIPIDSDLEPGQSKLFVREISTDNIDPIGPETVKPVIVKYEYR
jgi:hypothetical protein